LKAHDGTIFPEYGPGITWNQWPKGSARKSLWSSNALHRQANDEGCVRDVAMLSAHTERHCNAPGGRLNFPNVMAAVAVGLHFGVSIDEIKAAAGKL